MEGAAFIALVVCGLGVALGLSGWIVGRLERRKPMARYVRTDILPPPSSQCERHCYREMQ